MRESPSLSIIPVLQKAGLKIRAYDPRGMHEAKKLLSDIEYCQSAESAAEGANAIMILTEWSEFKKIDLSRLKVKNKVMLDLRNMLDKNNVGDFDYYSIGRRPMLAENLIKQKASA